MARKPPSVTVYKRPDGRYSVRWRERGKQREERGHTTQAEADERAHQIRIELRRTLPTRSRHTLDDLIREWWDNYAETTLRRSTLSTYERVITTVVNSGIHDEPASEITTARLNIWARDQLATGEAASTIRIALVVLSSVFQRHVEWGNVDSNPVRGVRKPKEARAPITIPTDEQVIRLGITAPSVKWRAALLLATRCGLRQQELFAIRWKHIHANHVTIVEAVAEGHSSPVKTDNALRDIPLPAAVAEVLEEWRAEHQGAHAETRVFETVTGSVYQRGNFAQQIWTPWREAAGVQVQWRHFRHYYASQLAASGATMLQASRWMGHESFATTADLYAMLFEKDTKAVLDRLDGRW